MHAGVAPQINKIEMTPQYVNNKCRPFYDKAARMEKNVDPSVADFFSGSTSLFWYRGTESYRSGR
jgi:hypothetical protein